MYELKNQLSRFCTDKLIAPPVHGHQLFCEITFFCNEFVYTVKKTTIKHKNWLEWFCLDCKQIKLCSRALAEQCRNIRTRTSVKKVSQTNVWEHEWTGSRAVTTNSSRLSRANDVTDRCFADRPRSAEVLRSARPSGTAPAGSLESTVVVRGASRALVATMLFQLYNGLPRLATILAVVFVVVLCDDSESSLTARMRNISEDLHRKLERILDEQNVIYSSVNMTGLPYNATTKFCPKGMGQLYNITNRFIDLVQSKQAFPEGESTQQ